MVDYFNLPAILGYLCLIVIVVGFLVIFFVPEMISGSLLGKAIGEKQKKSRSGLKKKLLK